MIIKRQIGKRPLHDSQGGLFVMNYLDLIIVLTPKKVCIYLSIINFRLCSKAWVKASLKLNIFIYRCISVKNFMN
jgi:hypothetical protein